MDSSHESLFFKSKQGKEELLDEASKCVLICLSFCNTVSPYSADACLCSQFWFCLKRVNLNTFLGIFMEWIYAVDLKVCKSSKKCKIFQLCSSSYSL